MECNCNNNNSNGGVIPWVRGNRLPLIICVYENVVTQEQVGDSTLTVNEMTRVPYEIQDNDTVTVIMKSGFRQVAMPFTTDGNKVMVTDNGELPTGAYTVEVTIERGDGARGRWQETRQVRIYENTSEAQLGEMYSIDADLFFYAKGDTGVGIADITPNQDNTLTITMTDGTTYTTEAVKGEKGDKGDTGERGTSIVSFDVTGQTDVSVIYTVTFSDDTTQEVAVPKGPQGDTGLTGNGISSTTLNSDYTLTIAYTDGTTYTTPSIRGAQGAQGVSVIGFTQTGETATNTMYNLVFSDGRTQSVAIPKGVKGDKGDTGDDGNVGPQGAQGPKGDTVTATDYTLYNVQGSDSQGAMSQDATTKAISAQTGYYTCGTADGIPEKVVTVESGNLYKRTLGGHFKVQMTNKNTAASGVTLQIGSETAAALWYNGAAVSATNTWDAGEVISVYYDGSVYQASNAHGGSNKKLDAYLYGDLRTLAVGQTYKFDESVKTTDKQFLRITKAITTLSMSETLAVGDLKVNSNKTYRADKAINVYNPEGDYTENPYALGSLAEYTLTVTAENVVECTITVNGTEVSVDEGEGAASIATKIVSALGDIEGWTISRNDNVITIRCNTIGANTTNITITGTDDTGITVDSTLVDGTNVIRKYNGTSWTNAVPNDLVTDEVLIEVDAAWLAANAAKQNTVARDLYDIEINFKVGSQNKAINPNAQGASTWYSGYNGKSYFVPIEGGAYYMITANATTYVSFLKDNSSRGHGIAVTNFATGETACRRIDSRTSVVLKAPFDAKYLLVNYYWHGDITPKSVTKVSLFNAFNKANFVNFDNTTSKIESDNVQDAIVEVLNIADLADKRGIYALTIDDYIDNQQVLGSVGNWVYRKYNNAYSISKPIYLHKGDTITKSAFGSGHYTCAFAEWHMNNYKTLVSYDMWAAGTTSYTAERDMFVCASGIMANPGSVTITRNNSLIDNLANNIYDDNHTDYFYRLFGEIRVPTFTVTEENFINTNNNYAPSNDTLSLYTSPIFLSKGESIFVSFTGTNANGNSLFTLSDAEGNPIGGLSSTTRSGFGKYPTINMYQAIEDCYVIISGRGRYIMPYIVSDSVLQSYFNRIEGDAKGDVMSLWGTSETLLKLRQLNRPYNSHNSVGVEGPADRVKGAYNPWIIVHFSDIHNDGTNLRRIETFAAYYKQQTDHLNTGDVLIDDVLDTGDNVLATAGGNIPWNASNVAATFLNTIGNHDIENLNNFTFDGVTGWPAVYKKQMGQFRSQWGNVVFPSENVEEEGKCYYYKDYTSQNIRLIVLMNWTNVSATYLSNEYAWFESVLNDALTKNLTVVCAGHVKPGNLTPIDGCSFHAYEYGYETQGTASQFVILVDKFIRAGGTFACWLAGHTHYDLTGWVNAKYTENGTEYIVDNQLCLVVENAGGQGNDFERRYWNSDNRIAGTKSQDCFNIVCVNAAYYRVSVMRIGSQYDNSGQHKGGFCINYKTKKMLSCY